MKQILEVLHTYRYLQISYTTAVSNLCQLVLPLGLVLKPALALFVCPDIDNICECVSFRYGSYYMTASCGSMKVFLLDLSEETLRY